MWQVESKQTLGTAYRIKLNRDGDRGAARIVNDLIKNPKSSILYTKKSGSKNSRAKPIVRISDKDALAMLVEGNLTKSQYNLIKSFVGKILPN